MKEKTPTPTIPLIIISSLLLTSCADPTYDDYATNQGYLIKKTKTETTQTDQTTTTDTTTTTAIQTTYTEIDNNNTTTTISGTLDDYPAFSADYTTLLSLLEQAAAGDTTISTLSEYTEDDNMELYEGIVQFNRLIYYDADGIQQIVELDDYQITADTEEPAILETINWYYKNLVLPDQPEDIGGSDE